MKIPVVIAGAGPVGLTLALDLARRGIRCLIVERNPSTTRHPKMDITNSRSMELFRAIGITESLRAAAVPPSHAFDVSWITNFVGEELHRFAYLSVDEMRRRILEKNDGTMPLEPPMRVSQVVIEPVLRMHAERSPLIDLRFSTTFERFEEREDGVTVVLRDTGTESRTTVECRYVVGCDGGGSVVRQQLGIDLEGSPRVMERFMTHFRSPEKDLLMRWGVAWHYQSVYGTLIAQNDEDVWTLHSRFPDTKTVEEAPQELLRRFIGRDIEAEILVANPWTPHLLVARSYAKRRVFLAGDAAHQYIPTGGYGMNTGIGDATNLSWKLAAVLHGFAGESILQSYDAERRPIGKRNLEASGRNNDVRKEIGALYTAELFEDGPSGDAARRRVSAEIKRIGNLENEAWGIEHGYVYAESPVVCAEAGASINIDPAVYEPTTVPGARLPSIFLKDGAALYDRLGPWLTLISFGRSDHAGYFEEAARVRGVPLRVLTIDEPELVSIYQAPLLLVRPDHHVAWRGSSIADMAAAARVIDRTLGW